jgi:DNA repair protein RecN (Recombination protein N)
MLKELYIENLAIIEKAVITFDERLNVFSGETGAGKSILIGGVNAVLGGRVSKDIVRAGAEKAVVTALFEVAEKELILTREINSSGNSIARINGKTSTASELKEVAAGLIDVHGQHETRLITSREVQLFLIDSYGSISKTQYENVFREFSRVSKKLKLLQKEDAFKEEKIEILSAKLNDLTPYKLRKGEEEEVSTELNRLRNIQTISDALNRAYSALSGSENEPGVVDLMGVCRTSLSEVVGYVPECRAIKERIEDAFIELDDIKHELSSLAGDSTDAQRLPKLEERMSDFMRLKRKYGLDIDELIDEAEKWQSQLDELTGGDELLSKLEDKKNRVGVLLKKHAEELTVKRNAASEELSRLICDELSYLDMPETRLVFSIMQDKVTISGMDCVEMLIAVNKGEEPKSLAKIASGGELSRIMLAIKTVQARIGADDTSIGTIGTMVFDEIDAGISGRAANKVGLKLQELSRERQVLCVTHLAQIAAKADCHLLIEKSSKDGRTYTNVRGVSGEERKKELARIISGDDDELSLANAERLMGK